MIAQSFFFLDKNISGKKIILRKLERCDLEISITWLKDPTVNKFLSHNFKELTIDEELQWFNSIQLSNRDMVFAIIVKDKNKYIGNCSLHRIDWVSKTCELGIVIGNKEYWNKGYGSDVINSITGFVLNKLNLANIHLNVYEYNNRAIKAYKKCGFKLIKILKENHLYDNKYWDTYVMEYS